MGSEIANAKMSGYLEKKGKLRVVGGWKKYWFVLEGRLLLYYRSKEEYEAISPCKGSISLGPPCSIKPALASTCIFQIESRSNTIILRSENRLEQEKWMQAILGALNLNTNSPIRMSHFRYSADDLAKKAGLPNTSNVKKQKAHIFSRQNTMPVKKESHPEKSKLKVLNKFRKMSSDSQIVRSLENVSKIASPKLPKSQNLQRMLINTSLQSLNFKETILNEEQSGVILVDNVEYCSPHEIVPSNEQEKIIYTEPVVEILIQNKKTDQNKNSILIDNPEYEPYKDENLYDECQYAKRTSSKDKLYSTIVDQDDPYSVPQLPPRVKSTSTEQLPLLEKPTKKPLKRRGGTFRRLSNLVSTSVDGQKKSEDAINGFQQGAKLGRKQSFVNRVFSKITTNKGGSNDSSQHSLKIDEEKLVAERPKKPEAQVLAEMQQILNQRRQDIERIMPSGSNHDVSQNMSSHAEQLIQNKVFNYEFDEHAYYEPTVQKPKGLSHKLTSRFRLVLAKISGQTSHPAKN